MEEQKSLDVGEEVEVLIRGRHFRGKIVAIHKQRLLVEVQSGVYYPCSIRSVTHAYRRSED